MSARLTGVPAFGVSRQPQKQEQLIAANVDIAFIVCSLNDDFNLNRIERCLAMVHDAGAEPVVVLTKKDLRKDGDELPAQARALSANLVVESVNSLEPETRQILSPWCRRSHTVVMLGSSGAGKSTLTNTLLGEQRQLTAQIREDDSKGRHTTTARSLIPMQAVPCCWIRRACASFNSRHGSRCRRDIFRY